MRIVNVSSRAGLEVMAGLSSCCVAKATQIRLTEHVDAEQRAHGIRAFAVQPGRIGQFVVALASGRFDALGGRYLDIDWDLGALLREAQRS